MAKDFLLVIIAKRGLVNKALAKSSQKFSSGITFFAEGSVHSALLKLLGLDRSSKEVAVVPVSEPDLEEAFGFFVGELKLTEKNTGIAFSIPLKELNVFSSKASYSKKTTLDFPFHCIAVIVDKGKSMGCIDAALKAGASGGTILQGHGAGVPKDFYFPIAIEPQKDIVLIVTEEPKLKQIEQSIVHDLQLTKPGMGVLFVLPVNKAIGIRSAAQPNNAETNTQPDSAQTSAQPNNAETNTQLDSAQTSNAETNAQPDSAQTSNAETNTQPDSAEPNNAKTNTQPDNAKTNNTKTSAQPNNAETNTQPDNAKTNTQPSNAKPSNAKTSAQPDSAETNNAEANNAKPSAQLDSAQPNNAETNTQPSNAKTSAQPNNAETNTQPDNAKTNTQPNNAKTSAQPDNTQPNNAKTSAQPETPKLAPVEGDA